MLQFPCVKFVIVILAVLPSTTTPFLIHWIIARGLAVAVQLIMVVLGDKVAWFSSRNVITTTTAYV